MYCAKCGVRLAQGEEACPLCHLRAYHPDLPTPQGARPYPKKAQVNQRQKRNAQATFLTVLVTSVLIFTLVCNLQGTQSVSWWRYVALSFALLYFVWVVPMWLPPIPTFVLLSADFVAVGGYLALLNLFTKEDWFLPFAFPTLGFFALLTLASYLLILLVRHSTLFVIGSDMLLCGAFMLLCEFLLDRTFCLTLGFSWSLYVLTACALCGAFLLLVALYASLRRALSKKLFL